MNKTLIYKDKRGGLVGQVEFCAGNQSTLNNNPDSIVSEAI